jgi:NAD(P)-dependent dehydrogenase (short-subunit alcohol dehydrogenase family)
MGLLDGKTAIITGGARGIGAACAQRFAREGAAVAVVDIRADDGGRLCEAMAKTGANAMFVRCDVREDTALRDAFARIGEAWGPIDILVANAGINGARAPIHAFPTDAFDQLVATNFRGAFLTARHAVPHLRQPGGSLVFVASVNGLRTFRHAGTSVYGATKAAVNALAKSLALELGRRGIRVNSLCPGHTLTQLDETTQYFELDGCESPVSFPRGSPALRGGIAEPADVADVCLFLASDLSRHLSGVEVFVDGGQSLLA